MTELELLRQFRDSIANISLAIPPGANQAQCASKKLRDLRRTARVYRDQSAPAALASPQAPAVDSERLRTAGPSCTSVPREAHPHGFYAPSDDFYSGEVAAFEKAHPYTDLSKDPVDWGRVRYLHSHVDATFDGWVKGRYAAGVVHGAQDGATSAESENSAAIPAGGWRCFHCKEVFTSEQCARLHFGATEDSAPACQIKAGAEGSLLKALRAAEQEANSARQAVADESTEAARAYYAQTTRHSQALIAAEELGYERGLADGRALSATPSQEQSDRESGK